VALFGYRVELVDESSAVDHHACVTPHPDLKAPQFSVGRWPGHQDEADQVVVVVEREKFAPLVPVVVRLFGQPAN